MLGIILIAEDDCFGFGVSDVGDKWIVCSGCFGVLQLPVTIGASAVEMCKS